MGLPSNKVFVYQNKLNGKKQLRIGSWTNGIGWNIIYKMNTIFNRHPELWLHQQQHCCRINRCKANTEKNIDWTQSSVKLCSIIYLTISLYLCPTSLHHNCIYVRYLFACAWYVGLLLIPNINIVLSLS
jgi:hypothetical protein